MKYYLLLVLGFFLTYPQYPVSEISDKVILAIKEGNASKIAKHFHKKISLKIFDSEDVYSNIQAETVLKDFFVKHPPLNYSKSHSNSQKNGNEFFTGILTTTNGKLSLSFQIKKIEDKYLICQFRIENEKN